MELLKEKQPKVESEDEHMQVEDSIRVDRFEAELNWNNIPSLPLTKIFSHLNPNERQMA